MSRPRAWWIVLLAAGVTLVLIGVALVAGYVWAAVVERLGEPDQSLLFWLSPFLFLGIGGIVLGASALVWGVLGIRRKDG